MNSFTMYMTTDCNFKCSYCYEDYKNHYQLDEESLVDTLEYILNYGKKEKILIDFLGGEPLLKKDLIYQAVNYVHNNYPEREVKYYITTNGSLVDDTFISFMKSNHFNIRLSFDGCKYTHDLNRLAKDGNSCYEKILENILKIRDSGLMYSVRMTITQNTIPNMYDNILFLHEQKLDHICMIMDVYLEPSADLLNVFSSQVEKIVNYYIHEYDNNRKFMLDQVDGKLFNMLCDFGNCFSMCSAGINNFKILPDGNIYPCGFLTSDKKNIIGNIHEGADIQKAKQLAISNFDRSDQKCRECTIRDFCHGMKCGYMNYVSTGKINIPSEAECQFEQIFYRGMIKIIKHYLQQPKEKLEETLGSQIAYIYKEDLKLSKWGMKVKARLCNEA